MSDWVWTAMAWVGGLGMAVCLYGMNGKKNRGIPALTALDSGFKSLDMRMRYTPAEVFGCFDGVGKEGQRLLMSMWRLDFVFIIFFWLVMTVVAHNVVQIFWLNTVMLVVATLRALCDITENICLMRTCTAYPAKRMERAAAGANIATMAKWCMTALWVACLFVNLLLRAIELG